MLITDPRSLSFAFQSSNVPRIAGVGVTTHGRSIRDQSIRHTSSVLGNKLVSSPLSSKSVDDSNKPSLETETEHKDWGSRIPWTRISRTCCKRKSVHLTFSSTAFRSRPILLSGELWQLFLASFAIIQLAGFSAALISEKTLHTCILNKNASLVSEL